MIHFAYIIILFLYTDVVYVRGVEPPTASSTKVASLRMLRAGGAASGGRSADVNAGPADGSLDNLAHDTSEREVGSSKYYSIILLLGILYPAIYEIIQMFKIGLEDYFTDLGNYADLVYIFGSVAMSFVHMSDPYSFGSKLLMSIIVILAIRRTFNFLRIFSVLSPIVTMLNNVIWDLRIFLTFYFILVTLFSLMYGVLGLGNVFLKGAFQNAYNVNKDDPDKPPELSGSAPGVEYKKIGLFLGNILQTIRISMGDFGCIAASDYLTPAENWLFWIIWLVTAGMTCIIFLNFIVAEASASYSEVSEHLEEYIQ
jgi:hypothetical protein